ncbi:MAG: GNAT family N-acetyltransferase [Sulfurimonas sp.]|nr:GNAT family N-acetyltransferase [Sulfurimonas sp.]
MKIQKMQKAELSLLADAMLGEKWFINYKELELLYEVFFDDFFVLYKDEKPIGFISALRYTDTFAMISNFIILKEFRSLGFGQKLFSFALEHLKNHQTALDADLDNKQLYLDNGFIPYFESVYYNFQITKEFKDSEPVKKTLVKEDFLYFQDKDKSTKLSYYLYAIANESSTKYRVIYKKNKISSYGLCISYKDGYKLVVASTKHEEALRIISSLLSEFNVGTVIYMEVTKLEEVLLDIVRVLKMKKYSKKIKMYNKVLES